MVTATAAPAASKHWPASIYRRPDGGVEQGLSPARLREILRAGEGELWVDVDSNDLHQHALLEKVFDFNQTSNLYFFLGKNFLVTVHAIPSAGCDAARDRLLRSPDLLARGA